MGTRGKLQLWILSAFIVIAAVATAQAATTVMQVELGDSFSGTIGAAGSDTVQAQFNAAEGTSIRVAVSATGGSTLQPTIVLKNSLGTTLGTGESRSIGWIPIANAVASFTIPSSGTYSVEVGGSSGSGDFTGSLTGRFPAAAQPSVLSGRVTNSFNGEGVPGVRVGVGPYTLQTDATGNYSGVIPAGSYSVTLEASGFQTATASVVVASGAPATLNVPLLSSTPVVVNASVSGTMSPGGTVAADVDVELRDGSTIVSYAWTAEGPIAGIAGADTNAATVTLGSTGDFKEHLLEIVREPPITADQLPENVPIPDEEFPGGLQDRFQVVGLNPFSLEEAALVTLEVEVTTTSGTYHDEVEVHTALPWKRSSGLRSQPVGAPVLLYGKDQKGYDWSLSVPEGSSAVLMDPTGQAPMFTPDVPGLYEIDVTDEADGPRTLEIHAGNWRGVIVGQDPDGRPESDPACTICHTTLAPDKFTPWAQTGHAEIFTDNLNTSPYWGSQCFSCHTVGYDPSGTNSGVDEAGDYADFLGAGLIGNPGDNWTAVVDNFPATAQLANVQCENCHGPQSGAPGEDGDAHGWNFPEGEPRVSLSSDVCAVCHGEPLRHARFQQWQLSAHANYDLAIRESDRGSCSRCHTGNGFLTWLPVLLDDDPETNPLDDIFYCDEDVTETCIGGANAGGSCTDDDECPPTWTLDGTHPQTCATCHDPHASGTTSGVATNATVRISGDTPPLIAGFTATDVGRGAICMTCHNSRRGPRNDDVWPEYYLTSEAARAPHGSAQADMLMGQNAYLVDVPAPGGHATIEDTCVTCHMETTPPPDALAYNSGGTNHTFFASTEICADCHGSSFGADSVQGGIENILHQVQEGIEEAILDLMGERVALGNKINLGSGVVITGANLATIADVELGESRGRQAITVTFTDTTTRGPVAISSVGVLDAFDASLGTLYDFADPRLPRAGWNWALVHNDGSLGVHNPFFAWQILIAASEALDGGDGPSETAPPRFYVERSRSRSNPTERKEAVERRRDQLQR